MNLDLKVLEALSKDENAETNGRKKLRITRGAYRKARTIAKLVSKIAGGGMECYGYLMKPSDSFDDLVRDVFFAEDQDARSAFVRVNPEGVKRAGEAMDAMGYEPLGWWHSHGSFGTFHSGTDDDNFRVILHEISPRTMFQNREAVFTHNDGVLRVGNYTIEGVEPGEGKAIRIVERAERDPFAFSMVVNEREDYYTECITKTFNHAEKEFDVNEPYHPELEIVDVDDDVAFDIPDLEWEIHQKVTMSRSSSRWDAVGDFDCNEYKTITDEFVAKAAEYIKGGGKYSSFVADMLQAKADVSRCGLIKSAEEGGVEDAGTLADLLEESREEVRENIEAGLRRSHFDRYLDANTKYRKFELENLISIQFMVEFAKERDLSEGQNRWWQDELVSKYRRRAEILAECAEKAENAVKSMARYAMEEHTDYKGELGHKYRKLMGHILTSMSSGSDHPFLDAVKRTTAKRPVLGHRKGLLMLKERVNIFNQLTKDLYYMRIAKCNSQHNGKVYSFVEEFPDAYLNRPGDADGVIEKYLMPIKQEPEGFRNYHDEALDQYQRQEATIVQSVMKYLRGLIPRSWRGRRMGT
jgi:hypothetical protein